MKNLPVNLKTTLLNLLLLTATVLLFMGIFGPLMTFQKFYLLENQVSLFGALQQMYWQSEWLLFWVILFFSILFPLVKLVLMFLLLNVFEDTSVKHRLYLNRLAVLGKWSMLDVFVVALLLVTIKLDLVANVQVHYGVYAFAASVVITMLVNQVLIGLSRHSPDENP